MCNIWYNTGINYQFIPQMNFEGRYWNNSYTNYQITSQNPFDSIDLRIQQSQMHLTAMDSVYYYPSMAIPGSLDHLINPNYTVMQTAWGTPAWNQFTFNSDAQTPFNPWSYNNPWMTPPQSNSKPPVKPEEATEGDKRKYNTLLSLVNQLVLSEKALNANDVDTLKEALKTVKKSKDIKENYNTLLVAYNSIDDKKIEKFLKEEGTKLGVTSEYKTSKADDSFYNRLTAAGFEYKNTKTDESVKKLQNAIKTITNDSPTSTEANGIIDDIFVRNIDILDFISSWNSNNKNSDKDSKRIIKCIIAQVNSDSKLKNDNNAKKSIYSQLIEPLGQALIDKAKEVNDELDNNNTKIEDLIEKLEKSLQKSSGGNFDSQLSNIFDDLYAETRITAMKKFTNDAKERYGDIDSELFNENLLLDDMYQDLEEEGIKFDEISNQEENGKNINNNNNNNNVENTNAKSIGKDVYQKLNSYTDESTANIIKSKISNLNSDNILSFLQGFYEAGGMNDREHLIEALNDDAHLTSSELYALIDTILAKAEDLGLSGTSEYSELKTLREDHELTGHSNFDNSYKGKFWGWTGTNQDYKEEFDKRIIALYNKMIEKTTKSIELQA